MTDIEKFYIVAMVVAELFLIFFAFIKKLPLRN